MDFRIRYSSINEMLNLCKKLKLGKVTYAEIEKLLEHEDYEVEFAHYKGRVSKDEFINYFLNLLNLTESDIENEDLKIHHRYYKDLIDNLDYYYIEKSKELNKFTPELFEKQIEIALKGLPEGINLSNYHRNRSKFWIYL